MFEVETRGFSGPLDLLCELVESGDLAFAEVRLSEIVSLYVAYLRRKEELRLPEVLEFFLLASRLLYGKAVSLLPSSGEEEDLFAAEEGDYVEDLVEIYKPYRRATAHLEGLLEKRRQCFPRNHHGEVIYFDAGDLYLLSMTWWGLLEKYRRDLGSSREELYQDEEDFWEGMPQAIPEEGQVESRMEELRLCLASREPRSFRQLLEGHSSRQFAVLTLLALLEMCRKEEVRLCQKEVFGHIYVSAG